MTIREKKARVLARQLLALSFANGALSEERISAIIAWIAKGTEPHPVSVLKAYRALIAPELARHQAVIGHAGPVSAEAVASIAAALSRRYGRTITPLTKPTPALIAGLSVRVGDDVYEASVSGQLAALAAAR